MEPEHVKIGKYFRIIVRITYSVTLVLVVIKYQLANKPGYNGMLIGLIAGDIATWAIQTILKPPGNISTIAEFLINTAAVFGVFVFGKVHLPEPYDSMGTASAFGAAVIVMLFKTIYYFLSGPFGGLFIKPRYKDDNEL